MGYSTWEGDWPETSMVGEELANQGHRESMVGQRLPNCVVLVCMDHGQQLTQYGWRGTGLSGIDLDLFFISLQALRTI